MSLKSTQLESFVTDVLQQNLARYDAQLTQINSDIEEFNQLENTVRSVIVGLPT